jgi:hypothetical protein
MSCLDKFCIAHFKERNDFIQVTDKSLLLHKVDFSEKGHKIDEQRFLHNPDKSASSSGKGKKKVDDLINLSDDDQDNEMLEEDDAIDLGEDMLEEHEEEEELEAETGGDGIPLVGIQLGGVTIGEEYSAKLTRAKIQGTPRILFTSEDPSSQLAFIPLMHGKKTSQSS